VHVVLDQHRLGEDQPRRREAADVDVAVEAGLTHRDRDGDAGRCRRSDHRERSRKEKTLHPHHLQIAPDPGYRIWASRASPRA